MAGTYEIHRLEWSVITIAMRHCRNWLGCYRETYGHHLAHLELEAIDPEPALLPITETGYCLHFTLPDEIEAVGSPVQFVRTALDEAAKYPNWLELQASTRQMSLF